MPNRIHSLHLKHPNRYTKRGTLTERAFRMGWVEGYTNGRETARIYYEPLRSTYFARGMANTTYVISLESTSLEKLRTKLAKLHLRRSTLDDYYNAMRDQYKGAGRDL